MKGVKKVKGVLFITLLSFLFSCSGAVYQEVRKDFPKHLIEKRLSEVREGGVR